MMPSPQFIKSYFSSFTDDIISQPLQKGEKKDEDKDKEGEAAEVTGRWENIYLVFTKLVHLGCSQRGVWARGIDWNVGNVPQGFCPCVDLIERGKTCWVLIVIIQVFFGCFRYSVLILPCEGLIQVFIFVFRFNFHFIFILVSDSDHKVTWSAGQRV